MELELSLALPNTSWMKGFDPNDDIGHFGKKRRYEKAFMCKDGDDDGNDGSGTNPESPHRLNKSQKALVGWPPIKCRRNINEGTNNGRNMHVKVKMEGVAIGRKVDLSLLNSYQALNCALRQMFPSHLYGNNRGGDEGIDGEEKQKIPQQHNYTVTYEDEEGDWMLVGDVPWETFIRSVKRLKIHGN